LRVVVQAIRTAQEKRAADQVDRVRAGAERLGNRELVEHPIVLANEQIAAHCAAQIGNVRCQRIVRGPDLPQRIQPQGAGADVDAVTRRTGYRAGVEP